MSLGFVIDFKCFNFYGNENRHEIAWKLGKAHDFGRGK